MTINPVALDLMRAGRDQLAADLAQIDAGAFPTIRANEIALLRQRLASLSKIIARHDEEKLPTPANDD